MTEYSLNHDSQHDDDDAQLEYALQLSSESATSSEVQTTESRTERQQARGANWLGSLVIFMQPFASDVLARLHDQWTRFAIVIAFVSVCIALRAMGARIAIADHDATVAEQYLQPVSWLRDLQFILQLLVFNMFPPRFN